MENTKQLIIALEWFRPETLPTCRIYERLIPYISNLCGITENYAREMYGLYTVGDWVELLESIENKK